jgi:hypothetical protein
LKNGFKQNLQTKGKSPFRHTKGWDLDVDDDETPWHIPFLFHCLSTRFSSSSIPDNQRLVLIENYGNSVLRT